MRICHHIDYTHLLWKKDSLSQAVMMTMQPSKVLASEASPHWVGGCLVILHLPIKYGRSPYLGTYLGRHVTSPHEM